MADVKISALPAATVPLAGTEVLPIVQSATTRQVSVANLTAGRAISASSITNSALTSGRVPYATTAGLLTDSANLLYSGTDLTVYGVKVGRGGGAISSNTVVGSSAGSANTSGTELTFIGQQAGNSNLSGVSNVAVGNYASSGQSTGSYNSSLGVYAGYGGDGSNNTAVGYFTLFANSTGNNNTVLGSQALISNISGSNNTVVGYASGSAITSGSKNTIIGAYSGNQGSLDIRTASNYIVLSDGDGNPRGVFNNNGTFFIGAFTSPAGTQRLVLTANGSAGIEPMLFNELRSTAATENYVLFYRNGSQVGAITNTLSATAYVTSSDYRLKENIAPMTGALATVAQLKPVTYKWKATGENGQGFIAHELQALVPDCVSGEKDAVNKDGSIKAQGIDTSFLVATLTAAIQELKAEFDAYKATHP
jgi:hypothetical protein